MRTILAFIAVLLLSACDGQAPNGVRSAMSADTGNTVVVYHDPTCGCCSKWVEHLENSGFETRSVPETNMSRVKHRFNVPGHLASCHTAVIDGYVIEGHVPAADVRRLLEQRPDAHGLTVPGMPVGSPGMEYGDRRQAYDVLLFNESGGNETFNHYPAKL